MNTETNQMNAIIFDSGVLISFALGGLLDVLKKLKNIFPGKFLIPHEVVYEVIDRPMKIKRFELEALEIKNLLDEKVLELPESLEIKKEDISKGKEKLIEQANSLFSSEGKNIHLIDSGETA